LFPKPDNWATNTFSRQQIYNKYSLKKAKGQQKRSNK